MNYIIEHPYEALVTLLAVTTGAAICARLVIGVISTYAKTTPDTADDEAAAKWAARLDAIVSALDIVRRAMPRVVVGPLRTTQPIANATGMQPMKPVSMPAPPLSIGQGDIKLTPPAKEKRDAQ
jgi:hypothetical protein